ncbi:MAG: hypothetical protein HQM10_18415 [Candidatus Riflebacteria bacterium]|nr:hypothetical protein [Candidatus Riflebacteria bacterium]
MIFSRKLDRLLVILFLLISATLHAEIYDGSVYMLLSPQQFSQNSGVYRFTRLVQGSPAASDAVKLVDLAAFKGTVTSLQSTIDGSLFFLASKNSVYKTLAFSAIPEGMFLPAESSIFRTIHLPKSYRHWSESSSEMDTFWRKDFRFNDRVFEYVWADSYATNAQFIPVWDGITGVNSANYSDRWLTPNGWGVIPVWAHGTALSPWPGLPLDGTEGRPAISMFDFPSGKTSEDRFAFSPIQRRVYYTSLENLTLFEATDGAALSSTKAILSDILSLKNLNESIWLYDASGNCKSSTVLSNIPVARVIDSAHSFFVNKERTYYFKPAGNTSRQEYYPPILKYSDTTMGLKDLEINQTTLRNYEYLKNDLGVAPEKVSKMIVSEKFDQVRTFPPDYIFGSNADIFKLQNSWWGNGGKAFEYDSKTGKLFRTDFTSADPDRQPRPVREYMGTLSGRVDDLAVDGSGYLYVLFSESDPAADSDGIIQGPEFDAASPEKYTDSFSQIPVITSWMRENASGTIITVTEPVEGDFSYVKINQYASKKIVKYTVNASGSIESPQLLGKIPCGSDVIIRRREIKSGLKTWSSKFWYCESMPEVRISSRKAELSVVQIPQRPVVYNQEPSLPAICRTDGSLMTEVIAENESVDFKVEGYKPLCEGRRIYLKDVGIVGDLGRVSVNLNSAPDGTYLFDEDGNDIKSGFPSSMFESENWKTVITWNIDWVDPESDNSVLKSIAVASEPTGEFGVFNAVFPHPGNYYVWADIEYRFFDYSNLPDNGKPSDLVQCVKEKKIGTKKYFVQVQSAPSSFVPETYISNIKLNAGKDLDASLVEGAVPDSLEISCDVQFVRDANLRTDYDKPLETYSGAGVWHYDTYNDYMGLKLPKTGGRVYNCSESAFSGSTGLLSAVDMAKYNPGWVKQDDELRLANNGTRVDISPVSEDSRDLDFFRWEILAYPVYPGASKALTEAFAPKGKHAGGISVASGSFRGSEIKDLGERKYSFVKKVSGTDFSKTFVTPIDPQSYRLRLEVVYPRVSWSESSAPGEKGVQYRSLVPDSEPVRAVGTVLNSRYPTGNKNPNGSTCFLSSDSWQLAWRDTKVFPPSEITPSQIMHTTGDPIPFATMTFHVYENNPVAQMKDFGIKYQVPHSEKDSWQKKWNKTPSGILPKFGEHPETPEFAFNKDFMLSATFSMEIPEFNEGGFFEPGSKYENWTGSLSYAIDGKLSDGTGKDGKSTNHIYTFPATSSADSIETIPGSLTRCDNDPPGFRVTIVSPSDNRRWEIRVVEGIRDLVSLPRDRSELASSVVEAGSFRIDDGSYLGNGTATFVIPGCSEYPFQIATECAVVNLSEIAAKNPLFQALLPKVRRSSRLFVNLEIDDNVDYKELASASFMGYETASNTSLMSGEIPPISLLPQFQPDGLPTLNLPSPRARYLLEMPAKIESLQPQVMIRIYAEDLAGNKRELQIPVSLSDVAFDVQVIESHQSHK